MTTISLRLPDSLHRKLRQLAKQDHISMNQFASTAIAEKISALMAEDYLADRARRGSRRRFEKAMSKVADSEPEKNERL